MSNKNFWCYVCDCGFTTKGSLKRHLKTKKHLKNLEKQEEIKQESIYKMSWYNTWEDRRNHNSYTDMYYLKKEHTLWGENDRLCYTDKILVSIDSNEYKSAKSNSEISDKEIKQDGEDKKQEIALFHNAPIGSRLHRKIKECPCGNHDEVLKIEDQLNIHKHFEYEFRENNSVYISWDYKYEDIAKREFEYLSSSYPSEEYKVRNMKWVDIVKELFKWKKGEVLELFIKKNSDCGVLVYVNKDMTDPQFRIYEDGSIKVIKYIIKYNDEEKRSKITAQYEDLYILDYEEVRNIIFDEEIEEEISYKLVGKNINLEIKNKDDFIKIMETLGYDHIKNVLCWGVFLPKFDNMSGPTYEENSKFYRYETWEMYNMLSC